jgi:multidrug efflux pump subunit AcrB
MWFDTADIYSERMDLIGKSAYLGLLLVFVVLILSLRPRVALWVTAGIGVAFLGTFSLLPVNDVSLNIISTFAFLLVLGIVVDDAIVVGESIHQHAHEMGGGTARRSSARGGGATGDLRRADHHDRLRALAVRLRRNAQVTRQLSIVITVALTISLIEAFFILPSHLRDLRTARTCRAWRGDSSALSTASSALRNAAIDRSCAGSRSIAT